MSVLQNARSHRPRREKLFGFGRPRPLDREAKVRIMHRARALSRRTEKGRAYGDVTAKAVAVLQALLWTFHNAKSGVCFPSYERIAEAAACARSTVAACIKSLEAAGLLTWVNRLVRRRDISGGHGMRVRVLRTSNGYGFIDRKLADRPSHLSESEKPPGTKDQVILLTSCTDSKTAFEQNGGLALSLARWGRGIRNRAANIKCNDVPSN